jgi:RNA polymerase sigma-70 factor (ECF subfamily)
MDTNPTPERNRPRNDVFATTRWTLVLSAGHPSSPDSGKALAELYQTYWYPLYVYVRHRGHTREDAEDLVQSFFTRLLQSKDLSGLAASRGKFRSFLLSSLKHFLANDWDRTNRTKRGGGAEHVSWDWEKADTLFLEVASHPQGPEWDFDRQWAIALLERVMIILDKEYRNTGKFEFWVATKQFLALSSGDIPYADVAENLGLDANSLRVAVHRLRRRYREILRLEIAHTLADPRQVEEEFQSLRAALSS